MTEIDPEKLIYIRSKVDEVITGNRPKGIDREWIERTTFADRVLALEMLRWYTYGKERCTTPFDYQIEVVQSLSEDV